MLPGARTPRLVCQSIGCLPIYVVGPIAWVVWEVLGCMGRLGGARQPKERRYKLGGSTHVDAPMGRPGEPWVTVDVARMC